MNSVAQMVYLLVLPYMYMYLTTHPLVRYASCVADQRAWRYMSNKAKYRVHRYKLGYKYMYKAKYRVHKYKLRYKYMYKVSIGCIS